MSALGDFLKAKRSETAPEAVGLPAVGNPRRVRGLRREEVAMLAAVSVDHYTRLEQGRVTTASESVLDGIAEALRLSTDEHAYLRMLARTPERLRSTVPTVPDTVPPPIRDLLASMEHIPAIVLDQRADVLAWNRLGQALFFDFSEIPTGHRNLVRMIFLEPRVRNLYVDWPQIAADAVARLRMDAAAMPGDHRMAEIVAELTAGDADFRRWWGGHDVRSRSFAHKRFKHPVAGRMDLDWQAMRFVAAPEQTMITYTAPAGTPTADALRILASWAASAA